MVSPILCSEYVGECLARWFPSRLFMSISRNPVIRGIRVVEIICKSFEGEEINKFRKTEKERVVEIVLIIILP